MNMKLIAALVLVLIVLVIARTLTRRDTDPRSRLDLEDLLIGDDGKMSKAAAVMMGAFAVTTWMMVTLTVQGQMSEGYMTIYATAWIAPTVTILITRGKAVPPIVMPAKTSVSVDVEQK